jgi:cell division protein FtsL
MFFKFPKILKVKKHNPRQREIIRKAKAHASFLIAFGLIGSGIFFYIWPRLRLVTLNYEYNKLREEKSELIHFNKMLKLELATMKSLETVEKVAIEKMGMIEPEDKNVILIKVKN